MATKTSTRSKAKPTAASVTKAYLKYLLTHGKQPASVFAFADAEGMTEAYFYGFFSSFDALERKLWEGFMQDTIKAIQEDKSYEGFGSREKLLAFYYTHLQILLAQRSYVVMKWPRIKKSPKTPDWLKSYKDSFYNYVREIIAEAIESGEIKERPYLSERYDQAMWVQLMFVVDFWSKDTSEGFERTDAAIEKAVNLSFQLLGESSLDSLVDFAKFVWQSK